MFIHHEGSNVKMYHLLLRYQTSDLHLRGHFFTCLNIILICIRNRSLSNLCMNTLNEIGLGLYCSYVMFIVCIAFMFLFLMFFRVLLCFIVLMCICCILIKITYLLTYLQHDRQCRRIKPQSINYLKHVYYSLDMLSYSELYHQ